MGRAESEKILSRTAFLSLVFWFFSASGFCQSTSCEQSIPVDVRDRFGHFVFALQPASFEVRSHGRTLNVLSASVPTGPRRVVLLLDASGSVTGPNGLWSQARVVAEHVATSPAEIQLALVIFAGNVLETHDFSRPREEIIQRLQQTKDADSIVPKTAHQTALWDAIVTSIGLFGTPRVGDAIYAVTDGGDNHSHAIPVQVRHTLLSNRVRMFAFILERRDFATEEQKLGVEELARLAEESGGSSESVDQRAKDVSTRIKTIVAELYDKIVYFYRIDLPNPGGSKIMPIKVTITDAGRSKKSNVGVAYPHELASCENERGK
jgi:hypothetical protein